MKTGSPTPPPAPMSSRPTPAPVPRVLQGVTAFSGGIERRFSVRFMHSIEQRLAMAGLAPRQVEELTRRFGTMTRSMLDREGHIVDAILASSHADAGLRIYGLFSRLTSAVTAGGFRVEANAEGSWTVTPPDGEPFAVPNTAGASCVLADGVTIAVDREGLLRVGDHVLEMRTAENAARIGVSVLLITMYCLANVASFGGPAQHAMAPVRATATLAPGLREALTAALEHAGLHEAARALRAGAQALAALEGLQSEPATAAVVLCCLVVTALSRLPRAEVSAVRELLDVAGQSAVPSRRADPDAERALIMLRAGELAPRLVGEETRAAALAEISVTAKALRGAAREVVVRAIESAAATLYAPR